MNNFKNLSKLLMKQLIKDQFNSYLKFFKMKNNYCNMKILWLCLIDL